MNKQQEKDFEEWLESNIASIVGMGEQEAREKLQKEMSPLGAFKAGYQAALSKSAEREKKLVELVKMVQDNTKMPHQHTDYYTRLCCLSERATETLKELGYE